jgi:hypothetical protein
MCENVEGYPICDNLQMCECCVYASSFGFVSHIDTGFTHNLRTKSESYYNLKLIYSSFGTVRR